MTSNGLLAGTGMDRQIALEKRATELGESKYRDELHSKIRSGQAGGLPALGHIHAPWIEPVAKEIRRMRTYWTGDLNHTIQHVEFKNVTEHFKSRHLATICLHVVFNELLRNPEGVTHTSLCNSLWVAVRGELLQILAKKHDRSVDDVIDKLWPRLVNRWKKATPRRLLSAKAAKEVPEVWGKVRSRSRRIYCGDGLLRCVLQACVHTNKEGKQAAFIQYGLTEGNGGNRVRVVWMHYQVQEECHRALTHDAAMHPMSLPMLIPPLEWGKRRRGGQITIRRSLVIRATKKARQHQYDEDMPIVYGGLNWVASTPFQINKRILALQEEVWAGGKDMLDIPATLPIEESQFPKADPDTIRDNDRFKEHKKHLALLHKANAQRLGERTQYASTLTVARMFKGERLFFDQCMDFRGRMYPRSTHLTYTGAKTSRALLEFSEPKEPGEQGMDEIRIWAANCYGMDKLPYKERIQWTLDHSHQIARSVVMGLDDDFWQKADSPWEFMAACYAMTDKESAARLCVGRDGTANGLQHLAAMTRDETLAAVVNLLPGDRPGDLYTEVERLAREELAGTGPITYTTKARKNKPAKVVSLPRADVMRWIMRATVKQPCMTFAYGVTLDGAVNQTFNAMLGKGAENTPDNYRIAFVIAKAVLAAVSKIAGRPAALMKWMKECATIICKDGESAGRNSVSWINGIDFMVDQPYRNAKLAQIETLSGITKIRINSDILTVATEDQVDGVVPNVTHSFDMEHMIRNAYSMWLDKRRYFAQHDQHNTHAADVPWLQRIGRENFNAMYSDENRPLLLVEQWRKQHPDRKFPDPPELGNLRVDVSGSDYFTH